MALNKIIGENIRRIRTEKGWSQEKLSVRAKMSHNFIGLLERGKVNVSANSMEKIAKALQVDPAELLAKK